MQRFQRRGFGGRRPFGGGGFRRDREDRMDDTPKPVKVGEEYDIEVSEVGAKGDGIARIKNFVVFVNNVKQGEKARIQIKEVRNRFAIGEKIGEAKGETSSAKEASSETESEEKSASEVEGQEGDEEDPESEKEEEE